MYELNKTKFISERFDDETVLIDVENGFYYSLSDAGTQILDALEAGLDTQTIAGRLAFQGPIDPCATVSSFVERLLQESIIMPCRSPGKLPQSKWAATATPVAPPTLTRYEDMRDILLLDPVHLVDQEFGWPRR